MRRVFSIEENEADKAYEDKVICETYRELIVQMIEKCCYDKTDIIHAPVFKCLWDRYSKVLYIDGQDKQKLLDKYHVKSDEYWNISFFTDEMIISSDPIQVFNFDHVMYIPKEYMRVFERAMAEKDRSIDNLSFILSKNAENKEIVESPLFKEMFEKALKKKKDLEEKNIGIIATFLGEDFITNNGEALIESGTCELFYKEK